MAHPKEFAEGLSIGIIMDGNGRWAKNRGLPRTAGHKRGAEVFSDIADYCDELGVSSVYFYAFSTENWKRPLEEVNAIMRLFGEYLLKGFDYKNRNIRIKFMGDRTVLDEKLQQLMNKLEADSSVKTGMTLNIAINYGGRPEIVRAAQQLAAKAAAGEIKPEEITEQLLSDAMYTAGQKDPDFILRPSGEKRLSNFMLWQAAYSELVEMDVLWPDFTKEELEIFKKKSDETKLGFAILFKFFQSEGRFPVHKNEVPKNVIKYLTRQLKIKAITFNSYNWKSRIIKYHRAQIRKYFK